MLWWTARHDARIDADGIAITEVARLTHDSGFSDWATWSSDGNTFAYSSNRDGNFEIYVRHVEGGKEVNITEHPADDVQPAFSPNGTTVAFVSTRSSKTRLIKAFSTAGGISRGRTAATSGWFRHWAGTRAASQKTATFPRGGPTAARSPT